MANYRWFRDFCIRGVRAVWIGRTLQYNTGLSYHVFYDKDMRSELSILCDKYGTDKGAVTSGGHPYSWAAQTYADFYEAMFGHCREYIGNVFECGVGRKFPNALSNTGIIGTPGASLKVWREYFPNAQIFGADINRDALFNEERISTYHVDQTSPESIGRLWEDVRVPKFDLMIDDGLHTFEAGVCMFENSIAKLKKNGVYVIEDVTPHAMVKFVEYFKGSEFRVMFVLLRRGSIDIYSDNSLVVVTNR